MSLRKIALGTAAISSTNVLRLVAQILVIPVLARHLSPADYGVVAMAMPFVLFTMMFADAGVGRSLVRTSSSERTVWSTCFWLSAALGAVLALVLAAVAPLAALLLNEPRLRPILLTLTCVVAAQALCAIPSACLQRDRRFAVIAAIDILAMTTSIVTAITVALRGGGAWSLVAQQVALYATRLVLTVCCSSFRPLMVLDMKCVQEHLIFGRDVLGANVVAFLSRSTDNLIIGKMLATAAVGVYSMAFQFARLPGMVVSGPLQYVLYAQLAPYTDRKHAIARTFLVLTRVLAICIFPLMGMVAIAHEPVFRLLLSDKWAASGELFMIVAPACALQAVTGLTGTIVMVMGRTDVQLRTAVEFGLFWIASLLVAVWFGLEWAGLAYDCVVVIYVPRLLTLALPLIDCTAGAYASTLLLPAAVSFVCMTVFWAISQAVRLEDWMQVVAAASFGCAGVAASAFAQRRVLLAEVRFLKSEAMK